MSHRTMLEAYLFLLSMVLVSASAHLVSTPTWAILTALLTVFGWWLGGKIGLEMAKRR